MSIEVTIDWESGPESYTTISKHYSNYQTDPRLIEISEINRAQGLDYSIENPTVKFVLSNHDRLISEKIKTNDPKGKKVTIKDNEIVIFSGLICDMPNSEDPDRCIFKGDIFSILESTINKEISTERFPNVPEGNKGWGNILYGTAAASPGMMKATRIDTDKYHASYTELSQIIDVIKKDGTSILSSITWNVENGYTYINYNSSDDFIYFSGKGPEQSGSFIENPASMLHHLTENFADGKFQIEGREEAEPVFTERDYTGNVLFIDDGMTWVQLFKLFSKNFNCRVFPTRTGNIKVKVIRWGMETPQMTIHPSLLKGFKYRSARDQIRKKWMRQFMYDPFQKEYLLTDFDIDGGNSEKMGEFPHKFLARDICSRDVGLRESFFKKKPIIVYTFSIPKEYANQLDLGDTVLIKSRKNIFKNEYRQVEILREKRKPGSGFVYFEGYDLTEINKRTFILREPGHPEVAILEETDGPTLW